MTPMSLADVAAAAQNPSHPQHHVALGQIVGLALLGLEAFEGGPVVYASPLFLRQFISGVAALFITKAPAAVDTPLTAPKAPAPAPTGTVLG